MKLFYLGLIGLSLSAPAFASECPNLSGQFQFDNDGKTFTAQIIQTGCEKIDMVNDITKPAYGHSTVLLDGLLRRDPKEGALVGGRATASTIELTQIMSATPIVNGVAQLPVINDSYFQVFSLNAAGDLVVKTVATEDNVSFRNLPDEIGKRVK
jgi:hypothetical protein